MYRDYYRNRTDLQGTGWTEAEILYGIDLCELELGQLKKKDPNPLKPKTVLEFPSVPQIHTLSEFVNNYNQRGFLTVTLALLYSGTGKKDQDARKRAYQLAMMLTEEHEKVRLMDGHGRIFFLFCLAVIHLYGEERLNRLQFELYDLDATVNAYHLGLFRNYPSVTCIQSDILVPTSPIILLYLNFCGLGGVSGKRALSDFFSKHIKQENIVMLSFSTMRGHGMDTRSVHNLSKSFVRLNTGRSEKEFVTYYVSKSN